MEWAARILDRAKPTVEATIKQKPLCAAPKQSDASN